VQVCPHAAMKAMFWKRRGRNKSPDGASGGEMNLEGRGPPLDAGRPATCSPGRLPYGCAGVPHRRGGGTPTGCWALLAVAAALALLAASCTWGLQASRGYFFLSACALVLT